MVSTMGRESEKKRAYGSDPAKSSPHMRGQMHVHAIQETTKRTSTAIGCCDGFGFGLTGQCSPGGNRNVSQVMADRTLLQYIASSYYQGLQEWLEAGTDVNPGKDGGCKDEG
jgi:hypothetical protein